jgi:hypothetical protein
MQMTKIIGRFLGMGSMVVAIELLFALLGPGQNLATAGAILVCGLLILAVQFLMRYAISTISADDRSNSMPLMPVIAILLSIAIACLAPLVFGHYLWASHKIDLVLISATTLALISGIVTEL